VYAAAYFLMSIPVAFFYQKYLTNSILRKALIWSILITATFLLFLTGTRAAYVTIPVMISSYFLFSYGLKKSVRYLIGIVAVSVFLIYAVFPDEFVLFLQKSFDIGDTAQKEATNLLLRIDLTERLFSLFLQNPIFGWGPGYINKTGAIPIVSIFRGLGGQENTYLMILADGGIIGAATYSAFVFVAFMEMRRGAKVCLGLEQRFAILTLVLFVGLLFFSVSAMMVNSTLMHMMMILVGTNVGWLARQDVGIGNVMRVNSG
jgi:O-antigen ligase